MAKDEQIVLASIAISKGLISSFLSIISSDTDEFVSNPTSPSSALSLLLTFLPESIEPDQYVAGCLSLCKCETPLRMGKPIKEDVLDKTVLEISPQGIAKRGETILLMVKEHSKQWISVSSSSSYSELYTVWSQLRIRKIDTATGLLDFTLPFIQQTSTPTELISWYTGVVNVLCQLRLLYDTFIPLCEFENADSQKNVDIILQKTTPETVERDFEKLVVPYFSYTNDWTSIHGWIISNNDNLRILQPIAYLDSLARPLLVASYMSKVSDSDSFEHMLSIHRDLVVNLTHSHRDKQPLEQPLFKYLPKEPPSFTVDDLFSSPFTLPSSWSLDFFEKIVTALLILSQVTRQYTFRSAVELFFSDIIEQQLACDFFIKNCSNHNDLYTNIRTLSSSVFSRLHKEWLDQKVLTELLDSAKFDLVKQLFANNELLVSLTLDSFYKSYDSAPDYRKPRGSFGGPMTNASHFIEILDTSLHGSDIQVQKAKALLEATDILSAYTLTNTFGPHAYFKPLDIRKLSSRPVDIIHRILELNPKAYFDYQTLASVADQLHFSHYGSYNKEETSVRVKSMCVQAALASDDFRSAYNYCLSGLVGDTHSTSIFACLSVGKYVSPEWDRVPRAILEDQLTILSHILQICTTDDILTILSVWKAKENLLALYWKEEEELAGNSNSYIGGITDFGPSSTKSPIMSASKIAKALSSSASEFTRGNREIPDNHTRKRDQISNLLVSGLGWAIGANSGSR